MRRTKIVATIGPVTRPRPALRGLLERGVDVVRLNAAHGNAEVHSAAARDARSIASELGRAVGVLVDLPGPKLRTGPIEGDEVQLEVDARFVLTSGGVDRAARGDATRVGTSVEHLDAVVDPGDEVFLADGEIVLAVESVDDADVVTRVVRGGVLRSHKGMHLPRAEAALEGFTTADADALELALEMKAEYVGLSFVRSHDEVASVAGRLPKRGHRPALVAKIETAAALDDLDNIVRDADAVMVARGDLGIQVRRERVPLLQKEIIRVCNRRGTPVITATQMLESMTRSPLPTRAEVNDIANAVIDGTDALMLSEETAIGLHPNDTVETMAATAVAAEQWPHDRVDPGDRLTGSDSVAWAVAHAAIAAAEDLGAAAILCPTRSGATARRVAAFRPRVPVVGLSSRDRVLGTLALVWGVVPLSIGDEADHQAELAHGLEAVAAAGIAAHGDLVAVVAAWPGPRAGSTDFVRVVRV